MAETAGTAARKPRIHFTTVIGGTDVDTFPHLIRHYRAAGIESFLLIRQAESIDDPAYRRLEEHARDVGVEFFHSHIGPYGLDLHQRLIRHAMDEHPDDWYVVADSDEFHVYDRPLHELVELCEKGGYDYVSGCFLDRVAVDGTFPEIGEESLWEQYPLAGSVSAALLRALPLKVGLVRGGVELLTGQHGAPEARALPRSESEIQVHHFKWTGAVLRRLEQRSSRVEGATALDGAVSRESRRFLAHVWRHGGRIDVEDPRFRFHACRDAYGDHPRWTEVAEEAQGWQWTLI